MPTQTKTKVRVTLATFDSNGARPLYREARSNTTLDQFDGVTLNDYCPHGGTPLRDATAQFVGSLREARKANPDDVLIGLLLDESGSMGQNRQAVIDGTNEFVNGMRDVEKIDAAAKGTVLAVIFTDGLENASREVSPESLQSIIADAEKDGFTFIYLGANQDAWAAGATYGMSGTVSGQMVNYASTPKGTRSAMSNIRSRGQAYLGDNATFLSNYSGSGSTSSITEDGQEVTDNLGAVDPSSIPANVRSSGHLYTQASDPDPEPSPYSSGVEDALKSARKVVGEDTEG